jgi:DNA-binding response OmpR family regulator
VVEDDPAIQAAVELALESRDLPVRLAANGREGIAAIEAERPSLVFLDMRMPVLDGWGFVAELREKGFDPPLIVMTTREDAPRVARDIGADGHLGKPFTIAELFSCVEQHRMA